MMAFDSSQLPLPLNPRLSRPCICLPSDRILHHHSHFTGCALNYFPHLPSNAQGQNCHLLHHVRLKIPRGQSAHLLKHWKHTAQWRETRINQDCRTLEQLQFATTCLKTGTQNQKGPKRNGTVRENKIGEPRSGPFGRGSDSLKLRHPYASSQLASTRLRPRPRRHKNAQAPSPTLQAILFFLGTSLPQNKGGGVGWRRPAAAAAKICSYRSSSSSARQGKRDKYR